MRSLVSDYPKSLPEFQELFPDEDTCATWLFEMRRPDGFECPACGHKECCTLKTRKWLYQCKSVNLLSKVTLICRPIMPPLRDGRTVGEEPQPDQLAGRTIPILSMQIIPGCLSIAAR